MTILYWEISLNKDGHMQFLWSFIFLCPDSIIFLYHSLDAHEPNVILHILQLQLVLTYWNHPYTVLFLLYIFFSPFLLFISFPYSLKKNDGNPANILGCDVSSCVTYMLLCCSAKHLSSLSLFFSLSMIFFEERLPCFFFVPS